jgi:hypothetical protein
MKDFSLLTSTDSPQRIIGFIGDSFATVLPGLYNHWRPPELTPILGVNINNRPPSGIARMAKDDQGMRIGHRRKVQGLKA